MNRYALLISFLAVFLASNILYSQEEAGTNDIFKSRLFFSERDKLTSKMNLYTSWKYTYKYLRDNSFRFYKRNGRTMTLQFRYKYPSAISITNGMPITFSFNDGSSIELTNIQKVIYSPYLMGRFKYYDVEVRYKFNDDAEFDGFANAAITNIRFNFINEFGEEAYDDISISSLTTSNWQSIFTAFRDGVQKLEELNSGDYATNDMN